MDFILIIKAFIIGCLGAGGFYFVIAFLFQYFPLPMFFKARTMLLVWSSKIHKEQGDLGDNVWTIGSYSLAIIMLLTWWGIFGAYAYLLHNMLRSYILVAGNLFWAYYAIAITIPALLVLMQFVRFLYPKEEVEEQAEEEINKTLIEQILG